MERFSKKQFMRIITLCFVLINYFSQALSPEMHRGLSTDDVNVEGALFTTKKVGIVKSKFVIPPKMRMISPIPRRPSLIKPHDSDGNELDDSKYEIYKESDMNPLL
jgi:hypothetical protein